MLILGLNDATHKLAIANNTHWHQHVLRKENRLVQRTACLTLSQRKRLKRTWKKQVENEFVKADLCKKTYFIDQCGL